MHQKKPCPHETGPHNATLHHALLKISHQQFGAVELFQVLRALQFKLVKQTTQLMVFIQERTPKVQELTLAVVHLVSRGVSAYASMPSLC